MLGVSRGRTGFGVTFTVDGRKRPLTAAHVTSIRPGVCRPVARVGGQARKLSGSESNMTLVIRTAYSELPPPMISEAKAMSPR